MQLRVHARESGHEIEYTASDEYQRRLVCSICGQILRSLIALQRHQLACHNLEKSSETGTVKSKPPTAEFYFCSFCSMTFKTAKQSVVHRRTSDHKETVMRIKAGVNEGVVFRKRYCPHCNEAQTTLAVHKQHLLEKHIELCHRWVCYEGKTIFIHHVMGEFLINSLSRFRCPKCGKRFALSQDLTWHTHINRCTAPQEKAPVDNLESSKQLKCDECYFATDSKAELLFHVTLHGEPAKLDSPDSAENPTVKYECLVCNKRFGKATLRDHFRYHTGERPFPCGRCSAMFSRRSAAKLHQSQCRDSAGTSNSPADVAKSRERKYTCAECNNAFHTK